MKFGRPGSFLILAVALLLAKNPIRGDELVGPDEMTAEAKWVQGTLLSLDKPVVSFRYNGAPSGELLPGWKRSPISNEPLPDGRTRHRLSWTDPATGLEVRIVALEYGDYPAVEWTAYLKNTGAKATPIIEQVRGLDSSFGGTLGSNECVLRTTQGDNFSASSYEPLSFKLDAMAKSFQPAGGRPTNGAWPYFNIDGGRHGVILALGWPGQWQAQFSQEKDVILARGGQETTHLVLQPGEEIRTPLTAVLFWAGENWITGQNLWRHWFLAHNIPRPNGKLPLPLTAVCMPELYTSAAGEIASLNEYLSHGNKLDFLWIDAGWYEMNDTTKNWATATGVGTWKPDPARYPRGIRETSDYAHSKGMQLILWFEPERVYRGSFLWEKHPEWLLHWNLEDAERKDTRLLNLGNPAARQWVADYISHFITDQGVDLYRQDFNVDPLGAWETNDTPDRQGMTENQYVQGYLAYWDALLEQHPSMLIDSCASGGRRNDLETLRRSVPLLRSDYQAPNLPAIHNSMSTDVFDGNQGHTYGLSLWVPYYGTGEYGDDAYSARSHLCPAMGVGTHLENPDWKALARQLSDHRAVGDYFYGDYFPLTPYSKSEKTWMAWEFLRTAQGDGMVEAFRREDNPDVGIDLKLQGLKGGATYEFTNLDSGRTLRSGGNSLMTQGLHVEAAAPRSAVILTFKEIP
jgi:alpha-galactosidase